MRERVKGGWKFQDLMMNIASSDNFNGGDSNRHILRDTSAAQVGFRCLPDFVIRYNNYDEAAYRKFVQDISTIMYNEVQYLPRQSLK